ncbi:MAG TPA: DUF4097 family beta strand repeat-containing protein [Ignavibacteriaceae bacterium]|nr:DUF4097 family beta strand repeat-containing protein [Ignavibacteriaceae bacterium]
MKSLLFTIIFLTFISSFLTAEIIPSANLSLETLHHRTFKIPSGKDLILKTESGDVTITPWDKEEVEVKILGNERARERMMFSFSANDNKVEVTGKRDGSGWSWFSSMNLKYEIFVPASFNIEVSTAGGDIKIGGLNGIVLLNTSGGDIWVDGCTGTIDTKTSGGDINVFTSNSPVNARTSGGDINFEYSGTNKGIDLKTSGGDIDIKVLPDVKASVELSTSGGEISIEEIDIIDASKMSRNKVIANINGRGEKLIARTSGGDIRIKKLKK